MQELAVGLIIIPNKDSYSFNLIRILGLEGIKDIVIKAKRAEGKGLGRGILLLSAKTSIFRLYKGYSLEFKNTI